MLDMCYAALLMAPALIITQTYFARGSGDSDLLDQERLRDLLKLVQVVFLHKSGGDVERSMSFRIAILGTALFSFSFFFWSLYLLLRA